MFKFDFDIDDAEDLTDLGDLGIIEETKTSIEDTSKPILEHFAELAVHHLLDSIPQLISYSPLHVPLSSSRKTTTLVRRDLFDARFQLISEGAGDNVDGGPQPDDDGDKNAQEQKDVDRKALEYLDAPSDLVPGVYEGGLKTWECSLDLVDYLDGLKDEVGFEGKKVLDLGCGTGVPSMFIFREILDSIEPNSAQIPSPTEVHLQDYNASVLQLVTLPNFLLTWYTSIHADPYRYSINDTDAAPTIIPNTAGELPITPELKDAFLSSLKLLNITLRFFSGSWDTLNPLSTAGSSGYNIVLTSETIYRTDSLESLINLMQTACTGKAPPTLEGLVSSLQVTDPPTTPTKKSEYLCLVAAKVLYFGVGGGVSDFLQAVESQKGRVETVLERKAGIGRKIMHVSWS
ncbi:hypothetical protein BDN70DRAFT_876955 [Pholiota conissans]|uniref:protein-histidine N-methyltransferase n=1 Tax=Pholiota conissans TaxID=109636 RepID=A0A9P5Z3V3_9AGAR|nr:hypothetical protein BDN70DRAFT_876955 [Pholiota conissans]